MLLKMFLARLQPGLSEGFRQIRVSLLYTAQNYLFLLKSLNTGSSLAVPVGEKQFFLFDKKCNILRKGGKCKKIVCLQINLQFAPLKHTFSPRFRYVGFYKLVTLFLETFGGDDIQWWEEAWVINFLHHSSPSIQQPSQKLQYMQRTCLHILRIW